MKTQQARIKQRTIVDIERAAWFARLAFGDCAAGEINLPKARPGSDDLFYVIP